MNPAIFLSSTGTTATSVLDSDSIVVTRQTPTADPTVTTLATIYSGPADVQFDDGAMVYDPSGVIANYDAIAIIDPGAGGALPGINPGDAMVVNADNNDVLTVLSVSPWGTPLAHLELKLKRGPLSETLPKT